MSNTIDWEYSSNLSLMSISSYVEYETGNIYRLDVHDEKKIIKSERELNLFSLEWQSAFWPAVCQL